jgi:hypothetical protein
MGWAITWCAVREEKTIPYLKQLGVSEQQIRAIAVENPRHFFPKTATHLSVEGERASEDTRSRGAINLLSSGARGVATLPLKDLATRTSRS